ncbi:hypothetical protein BC831DRAFT_449776 [Entophlyctis helioformis]|nr:hypothetical protein BC831DRAFT_449776 [Entophlyctis helioformis]
MAWMGVGCHAMPCRAMPQSDGEMQDKEMREVLRQERQWRQQLAQAAWVHARALFDDPDVASEYETRLMAEQAGQTGGGIGCGMDGGMDGGVDGESGSAYDEQIGAMLRALCPVCEQPGLEAGHGRIACSMCGMHVSRAAADLDLFQDELDGIALQHSQSGECASQSQSQSQPQSQPHLRAGFSEAAGGLLLLCEGCGEVVAVL